MKEILYNLRMMKPLFIFFYVNAWSWLSRTLKKNQVLIVVPVVFLVSKKAAHMQKIACHEL